MNKNKYSEILHKLGDTRRKETNKLILTGLFNAVAVTLTFITLISFVEFLAQGDVAFRTFLAGSALFIFIVSTGYFLAPGLLRVFSKKYKPSLDQIALRIGNVYPDVKDRLCNAMQLVPLTDSPNGTSPELIYAAFDEMSESISDKNFDSIIEKRDLKRSFIFFIASILLSTGLIGGLPSSMGEAFYRIQHWNESFLPPPPFTIWIEPINATVLRGAPVRITVHAKGKAPETLSLKVKEDKQTEFDSYVLRRDSGNVYTFEISSLKNSIQFFASAQWLTVYINTESGRIETIDKPLIKSISGKLSFPSYTGYAAKDFNEQNADLSGLYGTSASFRIFSTKPLKKAQIVVYKNTNTVDSTAKGDSSIVELKINQNIAEGGFRLTHNGSYKIVLTDKDNQQNSDPINYSIVVTSDGYPSISMITPLADVEVNESALLPIKLAITDDYGFTSLKLYYRMTESKYSQPWKNFKVAQIPIVSKELAQEIPYMWDLNKIGITPEDKYEFYIEIADNDIIGGPKIAKTQTLIVRLPSMDEVLDNADASQDKIERDMKKVVQESEKLQKQMDELNRDMLKKDPKQELNWKEKKQAEEIMKKQAELNQKMSDIQNELSKTTNQLQQNNLLSPETMQKYMELQKLMNEVKSPELDRMQKQMDQAMKALTPEQMKKAMEQAKFDEERFKKSIERTMKILKRIQAEQKADALSKRADELEKKQNEIEKQLNNTNPGDKDKRNDLAKQQERLKDDLNSINQDMKDLEKLMKEIGEAEMPMKELDDAKQSLSADETSQDMKEASDEMENGNFEKAKQSQKKAANRMKQFSQKMQQMKKKMNDKVSKEAIRKMQKAVKDMIELSKKEENIKNKTAKSDYNSTQVPQYAQEQSDVFDGMMNVANSLSELSEKSFSVTPEMGANIGNSLMQMRSAIDQLADRRMAQAAQSQMQAMQGMNSAIGQMQQMLNSMQSNGQCENPGGTGSGQSQSQGGMSFQQKLGQLAAQQQAMNQSMQQMMQGQGGGGMSQEQRAQMGRIADKQGSAGKSLQELAKEQKELGGDERKTMGSLDKIAQEMQEVVNDIKNNNVTPETMKKQERILSRLLDASKSLIDRDFETKRESQSGKDYMRQSPNGLDLSTQEGRNKAMQELLRSVKQGYTKDYEMLIRKYFEALQSVQIKN